MLQPNEYKDLTNRGFFTHEPALHDATEALFQSARDHLLASQQLISAGLTAPALTAAYEGLSQLFRAIFEFREVRPVEGCWSTATLVACRDLGMHIAEQCFVSVLHDAREPTSCSSSFPSESLDEAREVSALLRKYLPVAERVVQLRSHRVSLVMASVPADVDSYTVDHIGTSAVCTS